MTRTTLFVTGDANAPDGIARPWAVPVTGYSSVVDVQTIGIAAAVIGVIATVAYLVLGVFVVRYLRRIAQKH
jgi:hypothetical protein